jgi:hypothetical protein
MDKRAQERADLHRILKSTATSCSREQYSSRKTVRVMNICFVMNDEYKELGGHSLTMLFLTVWLVLRVTVL